MLEILSYASSETLGHILLQNKDIFLTVQKTCKHCQAWRGNHINECYQKRLWGDQRIPQKPESKAIRKPYWEGMDVQLLDIQRVSQKSSYNGKFRCFLAERSLTLEFREWELEKYYKSWVDEIVRNPMVVENKNGYMSEFLRLKGLRDGMLGAKKDGILMKALKNGQRTLVIERQNPKHHAISVILSFQSTHLWRILYHDIGIIQVILATNNYKDIAELAEEKSKSLDRIQSFYPHLFSSNSDDSYDKEGIELRPAKRWKIGSNGKNNWRTPKVCKAYLSRMLFRDF